MPSGLESFSIMTMQVLHVVKSLAPDAGSLGVSLPGLFGALRTHDTESRAVTLDSGDLGLADLPHTPFGATAPRLARTADVLHLHDWESTPSKQMAAAALSAGKPYIISPFGSLSEGPHRKKSWPDRIRGVLRENRLVRRAAAVTAYNTAEHQALLGAAINSNVMLLPYGLNVAEYENADIPEYDPPAAFEGQCLLLLGPIHPLEGLVPLLKGFAEIGTEADGWHIVLAGRETGEWRKMLEAAVRRKGASDRVVFTGAPDVATQRAWLAHASALAAPSLHFRPPVSIMQAIAAAVPVIASDRAAPDGLEQVARLTSPNRSALREALRAAIGLTDDERAVLVRKAREVGRSLFDWSVCTEQFVRLYRSVA